MDGFVGLSRQVAGDPTVIHHRVVDLIWTSGSVEEASASLGLARAEVGDGEIKELLLELQRHLYRVMGDVAMPKEENIVVPEDVRRVDEALEGWMARTQIPNEFVVPG